MPPINFATNSYQSQSLPVSAQRVVNFYAEKEPEDAKTQVAAFGCPGLTSFATAGAGPVRGLYLMAGTVYAVSGSVLYSLDGAGNATSVGSGIGGTNYVSMFDNGTQLSIVTGSQGFIYTPSTNTLQNVTGLMTAAGFAPGNTVTFFDNYFIYDMPNTNKFFLSGLLNGALFNGLDFASAEVQPDYVLATLNIHELLLIFGGRTIETWYDAGALNFPFQRYDGGTIERGTIAPFTIIKEDNSAFFLGDDLIFYRLDGIAPRRISTHAIEQEWRKYGVVSDAFCFSYTFGGHKFITLTFVNQKATWVFDIASGYWHERESWDANNQSLSRWRGNCHVYAFGKHLVGDAFNGTIGFLDAEAVTEYGNKMLFQAVTPPLHAGRKRVFMSRFEMDMETGDGVTTSGEQSTTVPQVMMDYSDNGGRSYVRLQRWNSMGTAGELNTRLRWLRLGQFRQRVMRVQITDPVKRVAISAHADLNVGM